MSSIIMCGGGNSNPAFVGKKLCILGVTDSGEIKTDPEWSIGVFLPGWSDWLITKKSIVKRAPGGADGGKNIVIPSTGYYSISSVVPEIPDGYAFFQAKLVVPYLSQSKTNFELISLDEKGSTIYAPAGTTVPAIGILYYYIREDLV